MVQLSHLYMTTGKTTARLCDLTKRRPGERWTSSCATGGAILNSTLAEGWGGDGGPSSPAGFQNEKGSEGDADTCE